MKHRIGFGLLVAVVAFGTSGDLLACGDKFLVSGRGTRYQRPKDARAASILIYADPASGLPSLVKKMPVESVLKREGHLSTTVETIAQLTTIVAGGRYDVIVAASSVVAAVEKLLAGRADAPVVVALCVTGGSAMEAGSKVPCVKAPAQERSFLEAVDKAVERHDRNARKALARS